MKEYIQFLRLNYIQAWLYFGVAVFAGVLEALGLVSLVPVLEKLSDGTAGATIQLAFPLGVLLGAITFRYAAEQLQSVILSRTELALRDELVAQVFFSPWSKVRQLSQGQITSGVISESSQVANGIIAFLNAFSTGFLVLVLWIAAFLVNPQMVIVTSVFLILVFLALRWRLKRFRQVEQGLRSGYENVSEKVSSLISEIKFIRLSPNKRFWLHNISKEASQLSNFRKRQIVLPASNRALLESSAAIFLISALGIIAIQGSPLSQGVVFLGIFYRLVPRLQSLQGYISTCVGQRVWLIEWLKRQAELGEAPRGTAVTSGRTFPLPPQPSSGVQVEVRELRVLENGSPILEGVNLNIKSGEFLVITGRTGVGKTTLIDSMLGLRDAESGLVYIDSKKIPSDHADEAFSGIGVVTQDVPIFSGSLESNITCGFEIDQEWRDVALRISCLEEFVNNRALSLEADLSSKELSLSGGERQRIGLARAIYQKPSLLILDEATNGLDEPTERDILNNIRSLPWHPTIVAITHRSSLMNIADRVVRLDGGKLSEIERG